MCVCVRVGYVCVRMCLTVCVCFVVLFFVACLFLFILCVCVRVQHVFIQGLGFSAQGFRAAFPQICTALV